MGDETEQTLTDPWVRHEPEPDPPSLRRLAAGVFVGVVVVLVSCILVTWLVPDLWEIRAVSPFRACCGVALFRLLIFSLAPKRRRDWHHGPDVRWLLTTSRDILTAMVVGIAMSAFLALRG